MTLEEFIQSRLRTTYIRYPGISVYIRKCTPYRSNMYGTDFDLANMNADKPGKGSLTKFLDVYEKQYGFYIEIMHNERLVPYFHRRGYTIVPTSYPTAPDCYKWRPQHAS